MNQLPITLTLAQGNLILGALAERPFKQVFELIGILNQQATLLFPDTEAPDALASFVLSAAQLRLIIEALGELPFNRVHLLLQGLHQQLLNAREAHAL